MLTCITLLTCITCLRKLELILPLLIQLHEQLISKLPTLYRFVQTDLVLHGGPAWLCGGADLSAHGPAPGPAGATFLIETDNVLGFVRR